MELIIPGCMYDQHIKLEPYFKKHNITYKTILQTGIPEETINNWFQKDCLYITDPYCSNLLRLFPEIKRDIGEPFDY